MQIPCPLCDALHELSDRSPTRGLTQAVCRECGANLVFVGSRVHAPGTHGAAGGARAGRDRLIGITVLLVLSILNYSLLGAAVFGIQYSITHSEAYQISESFLRENEKIRRIVGEQIEFGFFPTGSIQSNRQRARAEFDISVKGSSGSAVVLVSLLKQRGGWTIVKATYEDESGTVQSLLTETQPFLNTRQPLLEERRIETLLVAYDKAVNQKNLEGILVHMADDMTFKASLQSSSETTHVTFTRSQYRLRLQQTYAATEAYIFLREGTTITLAPDGKSAKVEFQMLEYATFSGGEWQVRGTEVMRVELRNGRPMITAVELIGKTEKV